MDQRQDQADFQSLSAHTLFKSNDSLQLFEQNDHILCYWPPYWPAWGEDREMKELTLCSERVDRIPLQTRPPVEGSPKTGSIRVIMTWKTARPSLRSCLAKIMVHLKYRTHYWSKQTPKLCLYSTSRHSGTLRVADEMDPICCVLHYWVNSCLESLHLLPHGLQAGASVKQVDDRHIRARMGLPRRERRRQSKRARVTKSQQKTWSEQNKYVSINSCLL